MFLKILLVFILIILPIAPGHANHVRIETDFEQDINVALGEGAGEIAEIIQKYLKENPAHLIVYEAMEVKEYDEEVVSTIMFFVDKDNELKFYNQPLRTFLSIKEAEKVSNAINLGHEADYLRVNLSYFIDIIDFYNGIEVRTAAGLKEMNSEIAYDYLINGLDINGGYPYDHRERQELLVTALIDKMDSSDGIPNLTGIISILYNGVRQIDSNRSFMGKVGIGLNFINHGFENIKFYQPEPKDY